MTTFLDTALIIVAVGLILSVILQSKGAGLGGLTGSDASSVFIGGESKSVLFWVTIVLSVLFFGLAIAEIIAALSLLRPRPRPTAASGGGPKLRLVTGPELQFP
jgi:preprotein translocase subunit SecG